MSEQKMTREELVAWRAREIAWSATPLGIAFLAFKRALADAVREDTRAECLEVGWGPHHKLNALWVKVREAESKLRSAMDAGAKDSGC